MIRKQFFVSLSLALSVVCAAVTHAQTPMGTAFTYQGQLKHNGAPSTGSADLTFALWDAAEGGAQIEATLSKPGVEMVNGLFTVELDFGVEALGGGARWVEVDARAPAWDGSGEEPPFVTLNPRQAMTSVPHALHTRGLNINDSGQVSIGTTTPAGSAALTVESKITCTGPGAILSVVNPDDPLASVSFGWHKNVARIRMGGAGVGAGNGLLIQGPGDINLLRVSGTGGGRLGIGESNPGARVDVGYSSGVGVFVGDLAPLGTAMFQTNHSKAQTHAWFAENGERVFSVSAGGNAYFRGAITLAGGGDLAEPFEINGTEKPRPGMVVSIDPHSLGELRISDRAYDRAVAGIVSGANGVKPGLTLQQDGTVATGTHAVALTGRVWCYVDAEVGGSVSPGDLLTTSEVPGHAMKVTDHTSAQGAIIGKAMSKLDSGRGLVLVLVSLQ